MQQYLKYIQEAIKSNFNCESNYIESVPIHETFQGKTVWKGIVEVFELVGHPQADLCFAWGHNTDDSKSEYVTVLKLPPVDSPQDAVRASIVAESKNKP